MFSTLNAYEVDKLKVAEFHSNLSRLAPGSSVIQELHSDL